MADYEIRAFRDADLPSLLACFNAVFREGDPNHRDRTEAEWSWLFRDNPAGRRIFVALHEGNVVAQYAAAPYRVLVRGKERVFAHIVDSMAHPDHRAGLKRPGLFVQTALPFFEAYGGKNKDLVHYGWPNEKAWRIGSRYLGYAPVRTQTVLVRESGEGEVELPEGVEVVERFDEQARWLYDRCAGEWGVSAIRDDAFLNWRFVANPFHDYEVFGVRDGAGVLRGYAVVRFGGWQVRDMGLIVDWLVPPDEPEVGELLDRAVLARARSQGAVAVGLWLPDWSPWFGRFQARGYVVRPTDYYHGARSFHPRYDPLWLRDNWWYTLADSDLG